jgi:AraC-like DNA-binding protein
MIVTRRPGYPLSSAVECIWHYEGSAEVRGRERVLPDGRFQVVLNLAAGTGMVSGLRSQHAVIDTARVSWTMGVAFRPAGARGFFEPPALDFCDRSVPLELVWGPRATQLLDRLRDATSAGRRLGILEAALVDASLKHGAEHLAVPPAVRHALRAFQSVPHIRTVADVSREIGWSRRWLSHAFGECVGMTPKRFCRLMRFRDVVREVASGHRVDWADLALAGGFVDQAHLAHEFHAFSGLSPVRYLAAERPFPNHVRID